MVFLASCIAVDPGVIEVYGISLLSLQAFSTPLFYLNNCDFKS